MESRTWMASGTSSTSPMATMRGTAVRSRVTTTWKLVPSWWGSDDYGVCSQRDGVAFVISDVVICQFWELRASMKPTSLGRVSCDQQAIWSPRWRLLLSKTKHARPNVQPWPDAVPMNQVWIVHFQTSAATHVYSLYHIKSHMNWFPLLKSMRTDCTFTMPSTYVGTVGQGRDGCAIRVHTMQCRYPYALNMFVLAMYHTEHQL